MTTSERGGLLVLSNTETSGRPEDERGWLANHEEQLAELWRATKSFGHAPTVDFEHYTVMGLSFHGWPCRREISGALVEAHRTIVLQTGNEQITCVDDSAPLALVIAIPRRLLRDRALLVAPDLHYAFEFYVPGPPPLAREPAPAPTPDARADEPIETVPLPPPGHLRLVTLHDHNQVWVSHEVDGAISVFAAETSLAPWPSQRPFENLSAVVTWSPAQGRFVGGWDSQGISVHGLPPLEPRRWRLSAQGDLLVGAPTNPTLGPIRPAAAAPQLDGPENAWSAYASLPLGSWQSLGNGEVGLVDLDLVFSPERGAQLCRAPKQTETAASFTGCPGDAPRVWAAAPQPLPARLFGTYGPLVVRRHGAFAEVIVNRTPNPQLFEAP